MIEDLKPDPVMKEYWRYNHRFASLCNGILYHGKQIIHDDDIEELDSDESGIVDKDNPSSINRYRDLIRKVNINGETVIIAIENQQAIDKTMVIRDMVYGALRYKGQIEIKDTLYPIITLVLYYGKSKWNDAKTLNEMVVIPKSLEEFVNGWKMQLIDVKETDPRLFMDEEVRMFFIAVASLYNWNKDINSLKGIELTYDNAIAVGTVTGTALLIEKAIEMKGEMISMCQAVDEALAQSKEQGIVLGIEQGIEQGKIAGRNEGKAETIIEFLEINLNKLSNQTIELIYNCDTSKLKLLIKKMGTVASEQEVIDLIN